MNKITVFFRRRKAARLQRTAKKIRMRVANHGFHRPEWLNEADLRLAQHCENTSKQLLYGL